MIKNKVDKIKKLTKNTSTKIDMMKKEKKETVQGKITKI